MTSTKARVALQQRVMPEYRVPFFNTLGSVCEGGLEVFAGLPRDSEAIANADQLNNAHYIHARNIHILNGKIYFCIQAGFIPWLEQYQPQVLIVEANPRYLSTPAAIRWMQRKGRPVIGWGLGAPQAGWAETGLRSKFLKSLDGVIAYSQTGARQYIEAGFAPERVFVAPNAVTSRPQTPLIQRAAQFKDDKASLLFVGRLQERKRLDVLLKACACIPANFQPHLVIIGDGPDRSRLEEIARSVYPAAQFTGAIHGQNLEPFFHEADLFVLPGTGGLAVQQAMAHALPVLVGEADGTQAELVRQENGWLLPTVTVDTLSETLTAALSDAARLRRMGDASFRIVNDEVNIEVMASAFANAINTILAS